MDNSEIEQTLDRALTAFEAEPIELETGLDVDDPALLQLRKACRLHTAADFLRSRNGYYTVIIEASFAAIERTIQFYLLETDMLDEADFVTHEHVYELGRQAALYGDTFAEKLLDLWRNNRSDTYYREGRGSDFRAQIMHDLATDIHAHVLQLAGKSHECICQ
jgi:hypothetical protein